MQPSLEVLAEDTAVHLLPRPSFDLVDRGEYVFESGQWRGSVQRVRLGDVEGAVEWTRAESRRRRLTRLEWWVGWSATPADLHQRLLAAGLVPDEVQPVLTGMTLAQEPPTGPPEVDVRRILAIEEQLEALEVDWDVWGTSREERVSRAAWERERFDPEGTVHHFVAWLDGRRVGFGRAIDMHSGVALMGGAVLPAARGRGVYRALVHARWEHAVARGTPLLVVQAGAMSAPVLAGLGFLAHGELRLYEDPALRENPPRTPPPGA